MQNQEQINKLIELEKSAAKKSGFKFGLVVGIFIPILLASITMITLIFSKSYIEKKVGEYIVSNVMNEVFTAFPDAYFTHNREKIIKIFDDFTNAASNHKIGSGEFKLVGHQFLSALKDKRLTYEELDQILTSMQNSVK